MAYGLWFVANLFYPDHKKRQEKWYGFAQFKEQLMYSSIIGFVATLLSVGAIFCPPLILPAVWLYLIGGIFWNIGEYHKFKNPPLDDLNFSSAKQNAYFSYSITATSMSFVAALATTIIYFFPPITIPVLVISALLSTALGALALEYWSSFTFGGHKPTPIYTNSVEMTQFLGPSTSPNPTSSPNPCHFPNLLQKPKEKEPIKEPSAPSQYYI
jgi:hypothetical protein